MSLRAQAIQQAREKFAINFAGTTGKTLEKPVEPGSTYVSLATFVEKSDKFQIWIRITPEGNVLVEGKEKEAPLPKTQTEPGTFNRQHLLYEYYKTKFAFSSGVEEAGKLDDNTLQEAISKSFQDEIAREKREPVQEIVRLFDRSDFGILSLDLTKLNPDRFNLPSLDREREIIISHLIKENREAILSAISGLTNGRYKRKEIGDLAAKRGWFAEKVFFKKLEEIKDLSSYELTTRFDLKTLKDILKSEPNTREEIARGIEAYERITIRNLNTFIIHIGGGRASILEKLD